MFLSISNNFPGKTRLQFGLFCPPLILGINGYTSTWYQRIAAGRVNNEIKDYSVFKTGLPDLGCQLTLYS